jgi:hypothetical protein
MKKQSGVTLTILAATVVVMASIIGTISFNSLSSFRMNEYYNMRSDIELLDEKIAIYFLSENELPIIEDDKRDINSVIENYNSSNINYNPNNSGELYRIDLNQMHNLSLKNDDYYIDKISHTIYKINGIKIDDTQYHTVPYNYSLIN